MRILVDADACPVKQIIIRVANEYDIPVIMFIDTCHVISDAVSEVVTVDKQRDSVDIALVNKIITGDIVVTQDYGLAAMVLARGAKVLNQNGLVFGDDNMDQLLYQRHIGQKVRRSGGRTTGPRKRIKEDDIKFEEALRRVLSN